MCLTIAYFTGWTLAELKLLPVKELIDWHLEIVDLHGLDKKDDANPGRTR